MNKDISNNIYIYGEIMMQDKGKRVLSQPLICKVEILMKNAMTLEVQNSPLAEVRFARRRSLRKPIFSGVFVSLRRP